MSSYDDEKTNLKSIFGDNKYPTGGNFAELINLPDFKLTENNDGTITVNNVTYDMTKSDLGSIAQISEDFNNLPNGLTFVSVGQNNAPEPTHAYWVRTFITSAYNGRKLQVAQADSSNNRYIRTYNGSWNNWDSLATGSELNNKVMDVNAELNNKVTDNKDGTIKVNGSSITPADNNTVNNELNYKVTDNNNGSITVNGATFIPADNSKVAKLSGDNNFDTVPEVDNNPLLLASNLPSDLARTSQQTNFTAGLQSGGVSVATSDDLKSVENSAWHQLSMPDCNGMKGITLLYRNFISDHYMNFYAYGITIGPDQVSPINGATMLDLSSLIDKIESVSGTASDLSIEGSSGNIFGEGVRFTELVASGNKLTLDSNTSVQLGHQPMVITGYYLPFAKVNYDNWIGS